MAKSYKGDFKHHDDDPNLYGYDIKNVRRSTKKTIRKHKDITPGDHQGRYGRQFN